MHLGVLGAGNFASAVLFPALQKVPQIEQVGIASASGLHAQSAAGQIWLSYALRR